MGLVTDKIQSIDTGNSVKVDNMLIYKDNKLSTPNGQIIAITKTQGIEYNSLKGDQLISVSKEDLQHTFDNDTFKYYGQEITDNPWIKCIPVLIFEPNVLQSDLNNVSNVVIELNIGLSEPITLDITKAKVTSSNSIVFDEIEKLDINTDIIGVKIKSDYNIINNLQFDLFTYTIS